MPIANKITVQNNDYVVVRHLKQEKIQQEDVDALKLWFHAEKVFKNKDGYYFVNEISDAVIVEEKSENAE